MARNGETEEENKRNKRDAEKKRDIEKKREAEKRDVKKKEMIKLAAKMTAVTAAKKELAAKKKKENAEKVLLKGKTQQSNLKEEADEETDVVDEEEGDEDEAEEEAVYDLLTKSHDIDGVASGAGTAVEYLPETAFFGAEVPLWRLISQLDAETGTTSTVLDLPPHVRHFAMEVGLSRMGDNGEAQLLMAPLIGQRTAVYIGIDPSITVHHALQYTADVVHTQSTRYTEYTTRGRNAYGKHGAALQRNANRTMIACFLAGRHTGYATATTPGGAPVTVRVQPLSSVLQYVPRKTAAGETLEWYVMRARAAALPPTALLTPAHSFHHHTHTHTHTHTGAYSRSTHTPTGLSIAAAQRSTMTMMR